MNNAVKFWTNNYFKGHYPVGSAAVVCAETAEDAALFLERSLAQNGLGQRIDPCGMVEFPPTNGAVRILVDGNY